jgi:hypothetical protein
VKSVNGIYVIKYEGTYDNGFRIIDMNNINFCRIGVQSGYTTNMKVVSIINHLDKESHVYFKDEEAAQLFMNTFEAFLRSKYEIRDNSFNKI